jgi:hypothetical protein
MNKMQERVAKLTEQYNMLDLNQDIDREKFNFKEDKAAYYKALTDSREKEDKEIFRQFMYRQYEKMLLLEIRKAKKSKAAKLYFPKG